MLYLHQAPWTKAKYQIWLVPLYIEIPLDHALQLVHPCLSS